MELLVYEYSINLLKVNKQAFIHTTQDSKVSRELVFQFNTGGITINVYLIFFVVIDISAKVSLM